MPQRHGEISVAPIHQPQLDNAVTGLVVKFVVTEKRGTDPIQCAASCSITTVTAVSQAVNDNREITSWPYVYVQANSPWESNSLHSTAVQLATLPFGMGLKITNIAA